MTIITIVKALCVALPPLATAVCFVFAFLKAMKAKGLAKTEADKAAAMNDMLMAVNGFIETAEEMYVGIDSILKQRGSTSGVVKKENVMSKLQAYALSKGYAYDAEFWSKRVDDIVAMTRKVNAG